jgi:hypothetical protein
MLQLLQYAIFNNNNTSVQLNKGNQAMTKRLEILKVSLEKKQNDFDARLSDHFDDVRSANGQPLNDKRGGYKTLNRWEKQNESLRDRQKGIEKTEMAIEREESKIAYCERTLADLPQCIVDLVKDGTLIQWRKFPNTFFIANVEKGRLGFNFEKKCVFHRYYSEIPTLEQKTKFREIYNNLNKEINTQS